VKAPIEQRPLLDKMSRSQESESDFIKERVAMADNTSQKITYQIGKTTFIVTPVYQTAQGESIAAILLRLMKADAERV